MTVFLKDRICVNSGALGWMKTITFFVLWMYVITCMKNLFVWWNQRKMWLAYQKNEKRQISCREYSQGHRSTGICLSSKLIKTWKISYSIYFSNGFPRARCGSRGLMDIILNWNRKQKQHNECKLSKLQDWFNIMLQNKLFFGTQFFGNSYII